MQDQHIGFVELNPEIQQNGFQQTPKISLVKTFQALGIEPTNHEQLFYTLVSSNVEAQNYTLLVLVEKD